MQLIHNVAGVVAFAMKLRKADEHRAFLGLAVLLNRGVGKIGAQSRQRNRLAELEDDARAAREVDAQVDALGEDRSLRRRR